MASFHFCPIFLFLLLRSSASSLCGDAASCILCKLIVAQFASDLVFPVAWLVWVTGCIHGLLNCLPHPWHFVSCLHRHWFLSFVPYLSRSFLQKSLCLVLLVCCTVFPHVSCVTCMYCGSLQMC